MSIVEEPTPPNDSPNPSPGQDHDPETLGQYLGQIRSKKNIDLKKIALTTRINYHILCSLENDSLDNLPNRTYLRGFVKCFAREIGAEEKHALKLFDKQLDVCEPAPASAEKTTGVNLRINSVFEQNLAQLTKIKNSAHKIPGKYLIVGLVLLGCLGGVIFFIQQTLIATQEAAQPPLEQNQDQAAAPLPPTASPPPATKTAPPLKPEVSPPPTPPPEGEEKVTAQAKESISLSAMQYPLYTLSAQHPKLGDNALFPDKIRNSYTPGTEHVFINATRDDAWLVYQKSQEPIKSFTLKRGQTLFLRSKEIKIFLGNLEAVEIFYNNQYLEAQAINGVKSLIFPHKLAKQAQIPFFTYDQQQGKFFLTTDSAQKQPPQ